MTKLDELKERALKDKEVAKEYDVWTPTTIDGVYFLQGSSSIEVYPGTGENPFPFEKSKEVIHD